MQEPVHHAAYLPNFTYSSFSYQSGKACMRIKTTSVICTSSGVYCFYVSEYTYTDNATRHNAFAICVVIHTDNLLIDHCLLGIRTPVAARLNLSY